MTLTLELPREIEDALVEEARRQGLSIEGYALSVLSGRTSVTPLAGAAAAPASREELRQRAFRRMQQGIDLGGPPYPSREELHDRTRR